jgi:hypothetical protein
VGATLYRWKLGLGRAQLGFRTKETSMAMNLRGTLGGSTLALAVLGPLTAGCVGDTTESSEGPAAVDVGAEPAAVGPTGPQGLRVTASPTSTAAQHSAVGPTGPQGPHSAVGPTGPQGPHSAVGPTGPQGPHSAVGPTGPQGPHSAVGPTGPTG